MHHHNKEKFDEICELIKSVDANGDAIMQTLKLRTISEKFRITVKDEKLLSEIFDLFNARSLDDEDFTASLVFVITSRQMDSFMVNGKILRHAMVSILQKNFQNADNFKRDNMEKFYNSIKLLGEYFNKARLSNGVPINIIGQSLLNLINVELEKELRNICHLKGEDFAKLVLSQIAINGSLLKTRHKTEIEQVLFTIRKCLIELDGLSSKTKAFLIMTLDLYYSNFTNVGDALEKMYETFLVEDIKVAKSHHVENGRVTKSATDNGKVQSSLERMAIGKRYEELKKPSPSRNLRVQIKKPEPFRTGPVSPSMRNGPASPMRNGPAPPASPLRNGPTTSPQKNRHRSPQKSSPPHRNSPQTPPKKTSPQDLRSKKSSPTTNGHSSASRSPPSANGKSKLESTNSVDQETAATASSEVSLPTGTDENILRQQNSRSSTPSSMTAVPGKCKQVDSKVYFREENVENLTWNGETSFDGDAEDPDASTSPKVNPYSSSFLNFLSSN